MATIHHPPDARTMPHGGSPPAVRVPPEHRKEAIARLLGLDSGRGGAEPTREQVAAFLAAAERDGTDLSLLWACPALPGGQGEAALLIPSSGRTAMFFVSPPSRRPGSVALRSACIEAAVRFAANIEGGQAIRLAQAIVEPEQGELIESYLAAGFVRLADLAYLRRPIPLRSRRQTPAWPGGIEVTPMSQHPGAGGEAMLLTALEVSYEGTLDCAALCGVRDVRDVLESHLSVGQHDPALWYLVRRDRRPVGCMLLSPCPEQQTVELVYLGLSPEVRGLGLGRALLELAIDRLGGRPERTLACAVDLVNAPALALYRAAKFRQFAVRAALIRPVGG